MDAFVESIVPHLAGWGLRVIGALAILLAGRIAAGFVRRILRKVLLRAKVDASIVSFSTSLSYGLTLTFSVLAALSKFGVETTSFIAVLGAAGFAVGFALQGSLSNFAAGMLTLVLRPYRVGDVIEAVGLTGKVVEITLFNTVLHTGDNVRILVPNGQIFGGIVKNFTANDTRRIDLVVGIGYNASIKKAREVLERILDEDSRVLRDPAPAIAVAKLGDSSIDLVVRPWVRRDDYWAVRCDLTEKIKLEFDTHGIEIPFPQRTVHLASGEKAGETLHS